jgi:hypothetical protein
MAKTYDIACRQCEVKLWIGQRVLSDATPKMRLYSGQDALARLTAFLIAHIGHHLEFCDDEAFPFYAAIFEDAD